MRYDYKCPKCGYFEAEGGREDSFSPCPLCGTPAKRMPYSGVPAVVTDTGVKTAPATPMREK